MRLSASVPIFCVFLVTAVILGISYEQSNDFESTLRFFVAFLSSTAVLAIFALALNLQWGYTGVFNFGVAGFFLVGAYTGGLITKDPDNLPTVDYIGGFGPDLDIAPFLATDQWFPFLVAIVVAGVICGALAFILGVPTLRLREDYLAITTIGIAELIRRTAIEEQWMTNGTGGLGNIPGPLEELVSRNDYRYIFVLLAIAAVILVYLALERSVRSPWGRVLRALREDELTTAASGKNVTAFQMQSFVLGAVIMGVGGAMYAFQVRSISPETFTNFFGTFLIWTMVIIGGSGNNNGVLVGAYVVFGFWQSTLLIQSYDLPNVLQQRVPYLRDLLLGVSIVLVLLLMPRGLIPEGRRVSIWAERAVRRVQPALQGGPSPPPRPDSTDGGE
jgi:branched-chain amino acid transport system permease protein